MAKVDVRVLTKIISIICGLLVIGLTIQRFIKLAEEDVSISKVQVGIMTINIWYS
jgi:hypothetical protein